MISRNVEEIDFLLSRPYISIIIISTQCSNGFVVVAMNLLHVDAV